MGRILAIDYGKKRVGLAVSDPLKIIATKLDTIPTHKIFDYLNNYLINEKVDCFVVGYPKQLNNQASEAVRYINPFIKKLKKVYSSIPVEISDERFTSKLALRTMIDGGVKKEKRKEKGLADGISATIILQSFMEQKRIKK